ncbi:hypothetical protein GCM10027398_00760 [Azotobacter salinestris]
MFIGLLLNLKMAGDSHLPSWRIGAEWDEEESIPLVTVLMPWLRATLATELPGRLHSCTTCALKALE